MQHRAKNDMIVTFNKEYLQELYEKGQCSDKKHRFQPDIVKRYKKGIDLLRHATRIEELYLFKSLHYEVLQGNKNGISSIRVNDQYRIEFNVSGNDVEPTIYICDILELSKHYR